MEELCIEVIKASKMSLGRTLREVTKIVSDLKQEILSDDQRFENALKERQMMEIIK